MTDDDYDALSQKQLASIKRDMRISLEDAAVRATYKVMDELETEQNQGEGHMTQDEIIEMARQSGAYRRDIGGSIEFLEVFILERFAKLVAEKEREACAKVCEDSWMAFSRTPNRRLDITPFPELEYVAKVIRARGQA